MKILILSPSFPFPHSGTQVRIYNILRNLARDHDITLVSLISETELKYVPLLEPFCERIELVSRPKLHGAKRLKSLFTVKGKLKDQAKRLGDVLRGVPLAVARNYLREYKEKVDALLRQDTYDIIKVELVFMEPYVNRELIRPEVTKVVLVEIDIAFVRAHRESLQSHPPLKYFQYLQYRLLRRYECHAWKRVDRIVAVSDVDKKAIVSYDPSLKVWVVPNPVDTDYYRPTAEINVGRELLFLGGLDFAANYDGLLFFLRTIFPLILKEAPDALLTVVGRHSEEQRKRVQSFSNVNFVGYAEDIRPYLDKANVFVVPLRIGGGTRVKILTAMAAGLPVVSTSIGSEGIEAAPEKEIILADNPEDFARGTLRLFEERELAETLQACGRKLVEERYAWDGLDLEPMLRGISEDRA